MKILLTGGSSEIGRAIIERRIARGDEVLFTGSNAISVQETEARMGGRAKGIVFDFAQPSTGVAALRQSGAFECEALVLNAFTRLRELKPFHEWDLAEWQAYFRANVDGNTALLHAMLPRLVERGFGRLLLISSLTTQTGVSYYSPYGAAKSALEALFLNLANDYGEHGICANIIRPGIIATERNQRFWKRSHYRERMEALIPLQAMGTPAQVASACDPFLERECYITGAALAVSGGLPQLRSKGVLAK